MNTNDKTTVETTELESIASSLKIKATSINEEYTSNCYAALSQCKECLAITGLDTDKFYESLNKIYNNINERCNELANYLINTIIPSYANASKTINENFNSNVGDKVSSLLGISKNESQNISVSQNETSNNEIKQNTITNTNDNNQIKTDTQTQTSIIDIPSSSETTTQDLSGSVSNTIPLTQTATISSTSVINDSSSNNGLKLATGIVGAGVVAGTSGIIANNVIKKKQEEDERLKKLQLNNSKI